MTDNVKFKNNMLDFMRRYSINDCRQGEAFYKKVHKSCFGKITRQEFTEIYKEYRDSEYFSIYPNKEFEDFKNSNDKRKLNPKENSKIGVLLDKKTTPKNNYVFVDNNSPEIKIEKITTTKNPNLNPNLNKKLNISWDIVGDTQGDVIKELEILKCKNIHLKQELKKSSKISQVDQMVYSLFNETLKKYEPKEFNFIKKDLNVKSCEEELVLNISDWHGGEIVHEDQVDGINEYNLDVLTKRVDKLIDAVSSITSKMTGYTYDVLNINSLGDMVNGIIHAELMQDIAMVDQVLIVGDLICKIINSMLLMFKEIKFTGVVGNHGRLKKEVYHKNKYDNFDYLVYQFVKIKFSNEPRIKFLIPKSPMCITEIKGYKFLLRHGDAKIQSFAGIPFYSIIRADKQVREMYVALKDIKINYHVIGHYHTQNMLDAINGKTIMVGSMKGADEFSVNTFLSASSVKQLLFSVHDEHGVTWSMDLNCG